MSKNVQHYSKLLTKDYSSFETIFETLFKDKKPKHLTKQTS